MPAETSPITRQSAQHVLWLGVAGAFLVYTGLVVLWLVTQPLFISGDESPNVDYAYQVTHGRIPVVESPLHVEFPELGQAGHRQYASNHPPAYHALVGPLVRAADASGHPRVFLLLARLLTAAIGGAVLLTLAAIAVTMLRSARERAIAVIATISLAGSLAATVGTSATIRNDALAILLTCATLLVLTRAARTGQRLVTVILVAAICTMGMLTRISFAPVWLLAIGAVAALELWPLLQRRRPGLTDLGRSVRSALIVLLVPLLGAGWFYVLSWRRYGDFTGGSAVYPWVADRTYLPGAKEGPLVFMVRPSTWWAQVKQLGGGPATIADSTSVIYPVLGGAVVVVLVLGVVTAMFWGTPLRRLLDVHARWTVVGLAMVAAAAYVEMAWHVSQKGVDTQRYLLNGIGLWAVGSALVFIWAPRRLTPYLVTLMAALLSVGSVSGAVDVLRRRAHAGTQLEGARISLADGGWYQTLVRGAELAGFPAAHALVALLLVVVAVGLALQLVALRQLCRTTTPVPSAEGTRPVRGTVGG